MSNAGPTSEAMEQLTAANLCVSAIEKKLEQIRTGSDIRDWDQIPQLRVELLRNLRIAVSLARKKGAWNELELPLVNLCSVVAEESPQEALELAKEFDELPSEHEDSIKAYVADARHIAYLSLGDSVRAKQQRAIAIGLRSGVAEQKGDPNALCWPGLVAAMRSHMTQLAGNEKLAINLSGSLSTWLGTKSRISLSDLGTGFGEFVTNDRRFHREATALLEMLVLRLQKRLGKPDLYLLHADPGSGKSFFVGEFAAQLQKKLHKKKSDKKVIFLKRNLSAYGGMDLAFHDIGIDVLIALTTHETVLLFIDEVDTELDGRSIFQRLIGPMNGDPFFFLEKQVSFAKQNLVVFFALSRKKDELKETMKFPDFLSRIPAAHQINLPKFTDPIDRIYRAVATLPKVPFPVKRVQAAALLYIGLRAWTSVRELEQALELAKMRTVKLSSQVLELADIALSTQDVDDVGKACSIDVWGGPINELKITNSIGTPPALKR